MFWYSCSKGHGGMSEKTFVLHLMAEAINQKQKVSTCQNLDWGSAHCVWCAQESFSVFPIGWLFAVRLPQGLLLGCVFLGVTRWGVSFLPVRTLLLITQLECRLRLPRGFGKVAVFLGRLRQTASDLRGLKRMVSAFTLPCPFSFCSVENRAPSPLKRICWRN